MREISKSAGIGLGAASVLGAVVFCVFLVCMIALAWPQERGKRVLLVLDFATLAAFCGLRAAWWLGCGLGMGETKAGALDSLCYLCLNLIVVEQCFYWFKAKLDGVLVHRDCVVVALQVYFVGLAIASAIVTGIVIGTTAVKRDLSGPYVWFTQLAVYWNAAAAVLNSFGFVVFEIFVVLRTKSQYKCCNFRTLETTLQCAFFAAFAVLEAALFLTQRLAKEHGSALAERVPAEATLVFYFAAYKGVGIVFEKNAKKVEQQAKSARLRSGGRYAQMKSQKNAGVQMII